MENQEKDIHADNNDSNIQPSAAKSAEEIMNEIENRATENSATEPNKSFEELEEKAEGLLEKIGFGKKSAHKKEAQELKEKLEEMNDRYLRLVAEFDNFKKRNAKERLEWMKNAGQDIIQSILPTLDDFNRAIKQMETSIDIASVKDGVQLIHNKLKSTLELRGLKQLESIGQEFNPELHEAITEIPSPTEELKGKVVDEIESGYSLNDKMLRYAKVIVGK
ncbi:protein GrpE [Bacteroidota bacterium]|nr:protein GrpE [Bacteroidota bacterium]